MKSKLKLKHYICLLAVLFMALNTLIYPDISINTSKKALSLCAGVLIPSLFPFFVFSHIFINLGLADLLAKPMSYIMRPVFGVSGAGAVCFVLGIISGYPLGAVCVCSLYKNGSINKNEAERLLAFCNNSGPLFMIGSVGAAMYMDKKIGLMLYAIHIISSVCTGVILSLFEKRVKVSIKQKSSEIRCSMPVGVIVKEAVSVSIKNMLSVCGFTIMFYCMAEFVSLYVSGENLSLLINGFLEISTGIHSAAASYLPLSYKLIATSAIAGFAGFSVHLQVAGIVSETDLSIKKYCIGKLLQSFLSALICYFAVKNMIVGTYSHMYTLMPYELIDFWGALKLALLYILSFTLVSIGMILAEKAYKWQNKIKYKR